MYEKVLNGRPSVPSIPSFSRSPLAPAAGLYLGDNDATLAVLRSPNAAITSRASDLSSASFIPSLPRTAWRRQEPHVESPSLADGNGGGRLGQAGERAKGKVAERAWLKCQLVLLARG